MTCPYREFGDYTGEWYCGITTSDCPEAKYDGFIYKECSTYIEEISRE